MQIPALKRILLILTLFVSLAALVPHGTVQVQAVASSSSPGFFTNLVWIMMENHNGTDIKTFSSGNSSYQTNLNATWASSTRTDYQSISGSLPNYIAGIAGYMALGSSCDSTPATCGTTSSKTLVDDLTSHGLNWKGYMEGMSSTNICSGGGSTDGGTKYIAHHNPFVYFNGIINTGSQCQLVVPAGSWAGTPSPCNAIVSTSQSGIVSTLLSDLATASSAPNLMYLVPNNCDNSHDGSTNGDQVGTGNSYLAAVIPKILQSNTFTDPAHRSVILVTYDEGRDFDCCLNRDNIYTVWIGPAAKNAYTTGAVFNAYSIDKAIEQNWGLPTINATNTNDLNANSMTTMLVPNNGLGTTSENNQFGWPGGSESFYAQGRYWLFYVTQQVNCEGFYLGDCLQYNSATDGSTWAQVINVNVTATDPNHAGDYAVTNNATTVFYVRCNCTGSANSLNDVLYRTGALSSSGTITWNPEQRIIANATAAESFYGVTITINSAGKPFVGYVDCTATCSGTPTGSSYVILFDPSSNAIIQSQLVKDNDIGPAGGNGSGFGECFKASITGYLSLFKFYVDGAGSPQDTNVQASVYKATGAAGSCTPTGSALATSNTIAEKCNSCNSGSPTINTLTFASPAALSIGVFYTVLVKVTSCVSCPVYNTMVKVAAPTNENGFTCSSPCTSFSPQTYAFTYEADSAGSWTGSTQLLCSGTADGSCPATGASFVRLILASQTGGKVYAISASGNSGLRGFQYSGSWTSQGSISNPTGYSPGCSGFTNVFTGLITSGDIVSAFWPPTTADRTCFNVTVQGVWQTSAVFFNFDPCTMGILYLCYSVTFDPNSNNYYMEAYYQTAANITVYAGPTPGTWKNSLLTTTGSASSSVNFMRTPQTSVTLNSTVYAIPSWYTDSASAPFQVHYSILFQSVPSAPSGPGSTVPPPPVGASQPVPGFRTTSIIFLGLNLTVPIELVNNNTLLVAAAIVGSILGSSLLYDVVPADLDKSSRRQRLVFFALATAGLTVAQDFVFHLSLTAPMEVPVYFLAKILVALALAYLLVPKIGSLRSAVIFTLAFDVYYAIGVLLLHIQGLSSSPTQIIEIAGLGSQCLGYNACDLGTEILLLGAWTLAHGFFFFAASEISWSFIRPASLKRQKVRRLSLV